jgi:hypothetical protein
MPGMAIREFKCNLCAQGFTMLSGDLMYPEHNLCDECLKTVWELKDAALTLHVAECLAGDEFEGRKGLRSPDEQESLVDSIVDSIIQDITWHRGRWKRAEEAIQHREQERGAFE